MFSLVVSVFYYHCLLGGGAYLSSDSVESLSANVSSILFVDVNATGNNDGTSWANAFTSLQDALTEAALSGEAATQIWVARGIYYPDKGMGLTQGDRLATFEIFSGIELYGGFAGSEIDIADRDIVANQTVLSGDLNTNDAEVPCENDAECEDHGNICVQGYCILSDHTSDNSLHVVTTTEATGALLDGFFIIRGNAGTSTTQDRGGAVLVASGAVTVANSIFFKNLAFRGGALACDTNSTLTLIHCSLLMNYAMGRGGAIFLSDASVIVSSSYFERNVALNAGGAIAALGGGQLEMSDSHFLQNLGENYGGAIESDAATSAMNCLFVENEAVNQSGGALVIWNHGTAVLSHSTFSSNRARRGAGVHFASNAGPCQAFHCAFDRNQAEEYGGGIEPNAPSLIVNCSFRGNRAKYGGGLSGGYMTGPVTAFGCDFTGNEAVSTVNKGGDGGAIHLTGPGIQKVVNCTFANNSAGGSGQVIHNDQTTIEVTNAIVWGNSTPLIESADGLSIVSYSLLQSYFPGEFNMIVDPLFRVSPDPGPDGQWDGVNDNYGDLRLQSMSPARDYGYTPTALEIWDVDSDGHPRLLCSAVDAGAYEFGIGDSDCDGDLDLVDFATFQTCHVLTGIVGENQCRAFDYDSSDEVDSVDFASFSLNFEGPIP